MRADFNASIHSDSSMECSLKKGESNSVGGQLKNSATLSMVSVFNVVF